MHYDYDVIVIGGGAAGLTASAMAANLGARTMMIERHRLGGDCTWTGCIPSKALLKAAKVAWRIREAPRYGFIEHPLELDFGRMMERIREIREEVYEDADDPRVYEKMGVDLKTADASFIDDHTLELASEAGVKRVSGRYIVIAAGARAAIPPIEGLDDVSYLTNESLFEINELPRRLAIVGGGPIGIEMSQAFGRLGSAVHVLEMGPRIMEKDNEELAGMLQNRLQEEGVNFVLNAVVNKVRKKGVEMRVEYTVGDNSNAVEVDRLLLASGRRPNIDGLNLEAAGVAYTDRGVTIDDRCRTSRRHIYAVGDVTGRYQFTHMSAHMARIAVTNILLKAPAKIDAGHVPWVTFTDPELGHTGMSPADLGRKGIAYEEYRFPYSKVDRAAAESETTGLIKVYAKKFNGKIYGADVLGTSAGELIGEYTLAMRNGVTLRQMADTIYPYPTYGLGARRAADQWYVSRHSPTLVRLLKFMFGYRGTVNEFAPGTIV